MSMSGIEVDQEINDLFHKMKDKKTNKWAIFKIENKKKIVVHLKGDPYPTDGDKETDKKAFEQLAQHLDPKQPCYILYDFDFKNKEGRNIQKLVFIFWSDDDNAKIGEKMIYASSKDTIKKVFSGIGMEFQINDQADLDYESLYKQVEKKA